MADRELSLLSEKNLVDILIFMMEGRRKENDFTKIVSNYYSVNSTLNKIVDAGLATVIVDDTRYHARWYELTPLGIKVAKQLLIAEKILSGESDGVDLDTLSEEGNTVR